jgi:hypothetical protein
MNNNDNEPQAVVAAQRRSAWRREAFEQDLAEIQSLFEVGVLTENEHKKVVKMITERAGLFSVTGGGRRKTQRRKTQRRKTRHS